MPGRVMLARQCHDEGLRGELEVWKALKPPVIQHGLGSGQYTRTPYLVTELIDGQSMRDLIRSKAPLPPDEAIALIRNVADGMYFCHQHQDVHRDLKP